MLEKVFRDGDGNDLENWVLWPFTDLKAVIGFLTDVTTEYQGRIILCQYLT